MFLLSSSLAHNSCGQTGSHDEFVAHLFHLTKEWLPAIRSTIRSTTYRSYAQHMQFHIVPHIGSSRLEKVSGATLSALYAKLAAESKRDGKTGLSPRTVHHVHTRRHRAFRDAVRWNRLFLLR